MPKKKPKFIIDSYGRFSTWNKKSRELPKILEFTDTIEAIEGNEFGIRLKVIGAKGIKLTFCINHPPIRDEKGHILPDFTGELYVNSNNFECFVGDGIWLPVNEKKGNWTVTIRHEKEIIASKIFKVV
ncbi:MAG: DUF3859 domain-containing protein [Bacteroidales bacterium]|nr:DUF3859 domain-containing protein [Bacteroidales bacterium]